MLTVEGVIPTIRCIGDRGIISQLASRSHEGRFPGGILEVRLKS